MPCTLVALIKRDTRSKHFFKNTAILKILKSTLKKVLNSAPLPPRIQNIDPVLTIYCFRRRDRSLAPPSGGLSKKLVRLAAVENSKYVDDNLLIKNPGQQ